MLSSDKKLSLEYLKGGTATDLHKLIPDLAIVTLALYALVMIARFNRLLQGLLSGLLAQLFGKDLIGSLRAARNARRPQALPTSE